MIVVGTALQFAGARNIVYKTLDRMSIPVIEVNTNPCIEVGFTLNVPEKSETSLE